MSVSQTYSVPKLAGGLVSNPLKEAIECLLYVRVIISFDIRRDCKYLPIFRTALLCSYLRGLGATLYANAGRSKVICTIRPRNWRRSSMPE
jgi:hypothetical protein